MEFKKLKECNLMAPNCSLKPDKFWDKSLRQGGSWVGPLGRELTFGRAAVAEGADQQNVELLSGCESLQTLNL